jgi:UDP-N-acetylglucosamine acyltransferase
MYLNSNRLNTKMKESDSRMKNVIHPTAVIGDSVSLGKGNFIGPYTVIEGKTLIGDNNWFGSHTVIGTPPEHREYHDPNNHKTFSGSVIIGSNNVFKEHFSVALPTSKEKTVIGSHCFFMHGSHVGHDCEVKDEVTLAPYVVLAGFVKVGSAATLGIGTAIHQKCIVGGLAMVGMNSTVIENILPLRLVAGSPARTIKINSIGMQRKGILDEPRISEFSGDTTAWDTSDIQSEVKFYLDEYRDLLAEG